MSDLERRVVESSVRTKMGAGGSAEIPVWREARGAEERAVFDAGKLKGEMWFRVMSALTATVRIEELYEAVFDSVEMAVGCREAAVFVAGDTGVTGGRRAVAWRGLDAGFPDALVTNRRNWGEGRFPGLVEIGAESRGENGGGKADLERRWASVIPLVYRGVEEGELVLYFSSRRNFEVEEVRMVEMVAMHLAFGLDRLRTEERVRELNEELQRKEEEFETLLDTVPVGIGFTDDPNAATIWGNRTFAALLGCEGLRNVSKSDRSLRLPFRIFKDGVEAAPEDLPMQRACREKCDIFDEELTIVRGDGSEVVELCRAKPLLDAQGNVRGCISIFLDITNQKRVLEALRQSESRFRLLAESLPHAVWTAKADGEIEYYNGRWSRSPKTGAEAGRWDWLESVHPDDAALCRELWRKCVESGEPFEAEFRLRDGDRDRWHLGRAIPLRDESGEIARWIGSCTDIDEQKRSEEYLEKAVLERTRELRETNIQLEEFVYSIAHDLRAPLRSMQAFSSMLLAEHGGALTEEGRNFARRIVTAAENMDALVLDLLAYGRMARREMVLGPVDVREVWVVAQAQHERNIQETGAVVETVMPLPRVAGHEATVGQVLANLLGNALKFTAPGVKPRVRLRAEAEAGRVRLWVEDNGIGIAPEYRERIFRIFERLDPRQYGGTGIGLSIVRKGIERMGGRVGVDSEVGKGSRFWIELPEA